MLSLHGGRLHAYSASLSALVLERKREQVVVNILADWLVYTRQAEQRFDKRPFGEAVRNAIPRH
jgi:hypothetical protein